MIQVRVEEPVYLKDPESTELGKRIVSNSIELIDKYGFEGFNFKKLAVRIQSTEASIYRYFENKHKLLMYLVSWYWNWLEYQLRFQTHNIESPERRLEIAIGVLSNPPSQDDNFKHIDEVALYRILVSESSKAFLTKEVDRENKDGYFESFKRVNRFCSDIILEINPSYKFPKALISTLFQMSLKQRHFSEHIQSVTEVTSEEPELIEEFFRDLIFCAITK